MMFTIAKEEISLILLIIKLLVLFEQFIHICSGFGMNVLIFA